MCLNILINVCSFFSKIYEAFSCFGNKDELVNAKLITDYPIILDKRTISCMSQWSEAEKIEHLQDCIMNQSIIAINSLILISTTRLGSMHYGKKWNLCSNFDKQVDFSLRISGAYVNGNHIKTSTIHHSGDLTEKKCYCFLLSFIANQIFKMCFKKLKKR